MRLMAATNRDLRSLITQEKFRTDLFLGSIPYRSLSRLCVNGPKNIPLMADFFIQQLKNDLGRPQLALSEDAIVHR